MKTGLFYAIGTAASILAIVAEALYARRKGKGWYRSADTLGNLNLAAGNLLLGVVLVGVVVAGYSVLRALCPFDLRARLPAWAVLPVAVLLSDFFQYWNHRLSHSWNVLWWGHITHHSSTEMNLSTGIRINWLYRSYAWVLYAPMPLLGFGFEDFVASQAVINVYNLFMHTRLNVPFGPLGWLLVTPASHRLHHADDPRFFGNYGAALIVWDRLFGTYRELPAERAADDRALTFGVGRRFDHVNPLTVNFHYLREMWRFARATRRSFVKLLLSSTTSMEGAPASTEDPVDPSSGTSARVWPRTGPLAWTWLVVLAVFGVALNQAQARLPTVVAIVCVGVGVVVAVGLGVFVDTRAPSSGSLGALRPDRPVSERSPRAEVV